MNEIFNKFGRHVLIYMVPGMGVRGAQRRRSFYAHVQSLQVNYYLLVSSRGPHVLYH